jgi:hypothetical protein
MIRMPVHMISSLTQMTMDAHLYRIFTQSKLHVHAAHKPVMLPNNKDQCPFTIIPQLIKMFLSSPFHYSHFSFYLLILEPSFPPFFLLLPLSVYILFLLSLSIFPCLPLHSFIDHDVFLFSSPFIFYCFACTLFFLSYYFFTLLCICARLNSTSPVCGI